MPIDHDIQVMKSLVISVKPGYDHAVDVVEKDMEFRKERYHVLVWYLSICCNIKFHMKSDIPLPDWGYPSQVSEFYDKILAAKKEYDKGKWGIKWEEHKKHFEELIKNLEKEIQQPEIHKCNEPDPPCNEEGAHQ